MATVDQLERRLQYGDSWLRRLRRSWCDDGLMISHADVRSIALSLPETHEHASYGGRPSFRTSARMFCWIRDDPEALVIWVADREPT